MGQTVQPGAPKESNVAYYLLMSILGISFLGMIVWMIIAAFE